MAKHEEKTFWDLFFTDFLADSYTTQKLKIQASVALLSQWNYCLIVKPTLKLHLNSTGTKQSSFIAPIKHISSNCIISTLFHCLTIAQFEMNLNGVRQQARATWPEIWSMCKNFSDEITRSPKLIPRNLLENCCLSKNNS